MGKMIRFNDEAHGTSSKPSNFLRTQLYMRSWFDKWPSPPATSSVGTGMKPAGKSQ